MTALELTKKQCTHHKRKDKFMSVCIHWLRDVAWSVRSSRRRSHTQYGVISVYFFYHSSILICSNFVYMQFVFCITIIGLIFAISRIFAFFAKIYLVKTWKIICSRKLIYVKFLKLWLAKINKFILWVIVTSIYGFFSLIFLQIAKINAREIFQNLK